MLKTVRPVPLRRLAFGAFLACASPVAAFAAEETDGTAPNWIEQRVQGLERGLSFFGGRDERSSAPSNVQTAQSSMADVAVRLDRLENQMRQLNGRLDEIQFQGRKNDEALKRFQGDVDFRFQDLEGAKGGSSSSSKPGKRSDGGDLTGASSGGGSTASVGGGAGSRDGGLAAPASTLGSARTGGAGRDAIGGLIDEPDEDSNAPMSIRPPGAAASTAGRATTGGGDRMASRSDDGDGVTAGGGTSRDQFDMGVGFVQRRDYGQAEATFRDFLRAYPSDPKASEARYWLGESLYQRKKFTDAADSFFKIYTDAPQSAKAPESMLKLGMSLNGMGKKEEACMTIAQAGKQYVRIKAQSDRELKRISC